MRFSTAVPAAGGQASRLGQRGNGLDAAQLTAAKWVSGVSLSPRRTHVGGAPARVVRGARVDEEPGAVGQADGGLPQRTIGCPGEPGDVSAPAVALAHAAPARVAEDFGAGDLGHEPDDTMADQFRGGTPDSRGSRLAVGARDRRAGPRQAAVPRRVDRRSARSHRGDQPASQCVLPRGRRRRPCRGPRGGDRGDEARAARSAPRSAGVAQGRALHARPAHHRRLTALRRPDPGGRRRPGRPPARRRRGDPRQDQHLGVRPQGAHRQSALRSHAQPVGSRAHAGWLERRRGGRGGRGARARSASEPTAVARCGFRRRSAAWSASSRPTGVFRRAWAFRAGTTSATSGR